MFPQHFEGIVTLFLTSIQLTQSLQKVWLSLFHRESLLFSLDCFYIFLCFLFCSLTIKVWMVDFLNHYFIFPWNSFCLLQLRIHFFRFGKCSFSIFGSHPFVATLFYECTGTFCFIFPELFYFLRFIYLF